MFMVNLASSFDHVPWTILGEQVWEVNWLGNVRRTGLGTSQVSPFHRICPVCIMAQLLPETRIGSGHFANLTALWLFGWYEIKQGVGEVLNFILSPFERKAASADQTWATGDMRVENGNLCHYFFWHIHTIKITQLKYTAWKQILLIVYGLSPVSCSLMNRKFSSSWLQSWPNLKREPLRVLQNFLFAEFLNEGTSSVGTVKGLCRTESAGSTTSRAAIRNFWVLYTTLGLPTNNAQGFQVSF